MPPTVTNVGYTPMNWLFARPLRPFVLLAAGASLLLNLMLLVPALYTVQVFDRVFASRSVETLVMLSLLVALALALGHAMDVLRARTLGAAGDLLARTLSLPAFSRALWRAAGPTRQADDESLRDVARLRQSLGASGVLALFDAPWLPVYLLVIGLLHPVLGLAATIGAALLIALALLTHRLTDAATQAAQQQGRAVQRQSRSLLRQAEVLVGMGMVDAAAAAWREKHEHALEAMAHHGERAARLAAAARTLRQALQAGLLGLGAWLVVQEHASPGIMVAATILLGRALQPAEQLIGGWKSLVEARAAWQRLEAEPAPPAAARTPLPAPQGRLELERVYFGGSTQRAPLIKGVSLTLEAGQSLGLVGPSGAGKTTLVRLMLGLWTPQAGQVRLDGADLAQRDRAAIGAHIGYLPQAVELFDGTVAENIARLGPLDGDAVLEAAKLAGAHEMILRLPQGYDTPVGEAGAALSGGQRQRIGLARALYGVPALVVLDEPNAHLDADGEAALRHALQQLKARGATVIVVAHRPAMLATLDRVAVLKDGAIDVCGPSAEVLARLAPVRTLRVLDPVAKTQIKESVA
jgi:PrtD family type I secretion system ABC transporter